MLLRLDILDDAGDNAVFVDDVGDAEGALVFLAVEFLFTPGVVG